MAFGKRERREPDKLLALDLEIPDTAMQRLDELTNEGYGIYLRLSHDAKVAIIDGKLRLYVTAVKE